MDNVYTIKSEVIVFDKSGLIVNSSNALFDSGALIGKNVFDVFAVLNFIKPDIENLKQNGEPLFLPHVAFSCGYYKSICDFVFLRTTYKREEVFTWMINDNSKHYSCVIERANDHQSKTLFNSYSMANKNYRQQFVR